MAEISNIDAIVELILREARAVKGNHLISRSYLVLGEVANKLSDVLDTFKEEERRKKDDGDKDKGN